jgi:drug/metabolite transporter (DMT)-like permease
MTVPTLCGCGAIALWAVLALLSVGAGAVPPLQLTAMSFGVSAVIGLGFLAVRGRLGELRQSTLAWAHGVGGLFGYHALYFAAIGLAPVAEANLINYLWPLLIVLFSAPLLGLRLRALHFVGIALGLAGCVVLLGGRAALAGGTDARAGDAVALAAACVWSLYSVFSRRFEDVPTGAVAGFSGVTAVLAAGLHFAVERTAAPDAAEWAAILLLGVGPVGAAFYLWDVGMKRGDPRLLGTLAYAIPVASTLLLCAAGRAPFTASTVVAAVLVAAGGVAAARA